MTIRRKVIALWGGIGRLGSVGADHRGSAIFVQALPGRPEKIIPDSGIGRGDCEADDDLMAK
jgi:hypothetical protein